MNEYKRGKIAELKIEDPELIVFISKCHAYSLSELVKYFRKMIEQAHITQSPERSDELTMGYCDELLEDLNDECV